MPILCDCCIRAVKSRGEPVLVGELVRDEDFKVCTWCEEEKDELYDVAFEQYRQAADPENEDDMEI